MRTMISFEQFMELAALYAKATGLAESTVSVRLFNDGKRLKSLREKDDGDMGIQRVAKAWVFIFDNWPEGVPWPKRMPKPTKVES